MKRTGIDNLPGSLYRRAREDRFRMERIVVHAVPLLVCALLLVRVDTGQAQQLEPRAYSLSPVGTSFLGIGYFYSSGGAVLDPSLPVQNVQARVYTAVPFYSREFGLFNRSANIAIAMPFANGIAHGDVGEEHKIVERTGLGDPAVRLAVNLIGGPAMARREFRERRPETSLGASLLVVPPLGQYDSSKLINLGTNRWGFKPELGLSYPVGPWGFEFYAGVWLYTANNEFFGGHVRRQDPIPSFQTHIYYTIRPRMWASLDFTYYVGGSTTVDGQKNNDRLDNTRGGLTFAIPLSLNQSVKLTWSRGVTTRIGTSFDTISVAWQWAWF